jgi:Right handed beta helix region
MAVFLVVLLLALGPTLAQAQPWTEPLIDGSLRSAPLDPPPVTGTTFYVDRNSIGGTCNNANPGTQAQPWCTIGRAAQLLTAGQRAYVRTGTYPEGGLHPTNSGTAGNYITFQAFPGESPQINCAGQTFCWDAVSFGVSYVVWNGFEAFGPTQQYMVQNNVNSHHHWYINGKYHDNGAAFAGFVFSYHHNVFSNNEIYNTGGMAAYTNADGADAHDNIFEFNLIHDNGRNGDDDGAIKCGGHDYNCVMRYNTVFNNYRNPGSTALCFSGDLVNCVGMFGLYLDFTLDNLHAGARTYIYNNVIHDNDGGLELNCAPQVTAFNNLVYHNGFTPGQGIFPRTDYGRGLQLTAQASECLNFIDVQVYNNTVINNWSNGLYIQAGGTAGGGVTLRNNLFMNNASAPNNGSRNLEPILVSIPVGNPVNQNFNYDIIFNASLVGGNLIRFDGTGGGSYATLAAFKARAGNTTWVNAIGTAPTFVNEAGNDYRQTSGSVGVNAGVAVGAFTFDLTNATRPQGPAWDIGAYEFLVTGGAAPTNLRVLR